MAGDVKRVEKTNLVNLITNQSLQNSSLKVAYCTRHMINASFILSPNEYTLFNFIIFMSADNTIKYSTKLLKQYDIATTRIIEITGTNKVNYATSRDVARQSFISLIEKGYLIRLNSKNEFMINPMVVYPEGIDIKQVHDEYLEIYNSEDKQKELTKWCNKLRNGK